MNRVTCVIVDDEESAKGALMKLIAEHAPFLDIVGTANSVSSGLACLQETKPDLVFLDVMLGASTSFDILEQLDALSFNIIFTTSHEAFALRAFDYKSIYYLIKPIGEGAFKKAIDKLLKNPELNGPKQVAEALQMTKKVNQKLAIAGRKGTEFIKQSEIGFLKSSTSYTEVFLLTGEVKVISKRLGLVAEMLNENSFLRIHKKYVVNLDEVAFLENGKSGQVYLKNGEQIPVGEAHRTVLLNNLKDSN